MKFINLLVIFISLINFSKSYEILGVLPFESKSHYAIGKAMMLSLAEYFHNVSVISPYPVERQLHFYNEYSITEEKFEGKMEDVEIPSFLNIEKIPVIPSLRFLYESGEQTVNYFMNHPNVSKLIESGKTYNACIIENTHSEALLGLAEVFQCILITYTTYPSIAIVDRMTSNTSPTSFVSNSMLGLTDRMTFAERFINTFNTLVENFIYEFYHLPNQRRLYAKYFPSAKHSFDDVLKNSSIIFVNDYAASSSARPSMPNMIYIGGIHVTQPKALNKKIQKFLDSAEDGAIIFTMGSMLQGTDWEEHQREAFVRAFSKLKQKVIWKYENETLPNKPDNVKIKKWLPQRDILAHENIKLFITHGGYLGMTEAIISGVPILGIPMYGDQSRNVAYAVQNGHGLKLDADELTEEKITEALDKLLNDPSYRENALFVSNAFKDRGLTPKLSVVYWTEFAIRHNGAAHLRSIANDMSFIKLHLLDVYCSMILLILLIFYVEFLICRKIFRKLFVKKQQQKKKVNKKQKRQ